MKKPALILQSVYRKVRIEKETKHEYLVQKLRDKITHAIIKMQA